ncbi:recombinase family protein [Paraburkholderia gardini]|uniref:recombinase family protein n=1 Tax=Paraburkholderia gardini TaxID=2823469 RepID=UPI001DDB9190|nr:recombinase family protein [Paraburkholderia gardini]CAG4924742.1 Tn3 family transposase ISYps3 [Paraburkholderia gardini]
MSRVFAYCRVSTADQHPENQVREIKAAGFDISARRVVTEHISGSTAASERPQFAKLLERIEEGDVLVVGKLDRLGRSAMDVRSTVDKLAAMGVRVHCLALGGADLTSPAGRMTMGVLNAVAEFERDLLIERTNSGLQRARAEGRKLGRPSALSEAQQTEVVRKLDSGATLYALAQEYRVDRRSIRRARDNAIRGQQPLKYL